MTTRLPLLALCIGLVGVVGCDALAPEGASGGSSLASPSMAGLTADDDSLDLLVLFVPGTDPVLASDDVFTGQDVRRRGYVQETVPGVAITVSSADYVFLEPVLAASPLVASVEVDIVFELPDILGAYVPLRGDYDGRRRDLVRAASGSDGFEGQLLPWNVRRLGGARSSTVSGDGTGTVDIDVYVIDSGVDHPDLNVVESVQFFPASAGAGSSLHGTHVAGIIGALDDGDGVVGVAPGVRIHSLDVFDASETASMSRLIQAIDYVTAAKRASPRTPMVANLSLGARTGTALNALDRAVQAAIAEGVHVVVAAGNQSAPVEEVSPAHVPEALTVGAFANNWRFAQQFSNFGSLVDLHAPGVRVVSTADGGRYAMLDGTSMAAPHITGTLALELVRRPRVSPERLTLGLLRRSASHVREVPPGTTDLRVRLGAF